MQILNEWMKDIPQQFLEKHNIEVLIKAFASQLQEVQQVFNDMKTKLDLDTATGQNLDYVGTIIPLSRKEAGELIGVNISEPVISDERYRQLLRYQNLVNTNECTYYDIIKGTAMLWDTDEPIFYKEKEERPATIFLAIERRNMDDEEPQLLKNLKIKSAGVRIIYELVYIAWICSRNLEKFVLRSVVFRAGIPFFGCILFDGSWKLDGSVILYQRRRYHLVLHVNSSPWRFKIPESIKLIYVSMLIALRTEERLRARTISRFFVCPARIIRQSARMRLGCQMNCATEKLDNLTILTKTSDIWFFDGALNFDGERKLNAIYQKEMIE